MAYFEGMADAPSGVNDTVAQTEVGLSASAAAAAAYQSDAHRFITENGAAVLGGHDDVGLAEAVNAGADPSD